MRLTRLLWSHQDYEYDLSSDDNTSNSSAECKRSLWSRYTVWLDQEALNGGGQQIKQIGAQLEYRLESGMPDRISGIEQERRGP